MSQDKKDDLNGTRNILASGVVKNSQSPIPNSEPRGSIKRRDLLKVMTAVPAALVTISPMTEGSAHAAPSSLAGEAAAQAAGVYKRKVLDEHEWKTVRVLSDIIIPSDERSGNATAAGVPEFIDDWLDFRGGELLAKIRGGLTWLDVECNRQFSHDFVDCSSDQQKQMLDRIAFPKKAAPEDAAGVAFFNALRDLVVSGFFSSEMGVKDLPYLGNQMVSEWKGCPPEVLVKLGLK